MRTNDKNLFSKLYVSVMSHSYNPKEITFNVSQVVEQGFKGLITDLTILEEYQLSNKNILCSLNYPYNNLCGDLILQIMASNYYEKFTNVTGAIIALNKFDIINRRWGNIRTFLVELKAVAKIPIKVVIDIDNLQNYDDISILMSIIRPHSDISPIFTGSLNLDKVMEVVNRDKLCQKDVDYHTYEYVTPQGINNILDKGFDNVIISSRTVPKLIQKGV